MTKQYTSPWTKLAAALCACSCLTLAPAWANPVIPSDTQSNFLRGNEHLAQREYAAALVDYNKALEINPSHLPSLMKKALINTRLGQTQAALENYTHVLAINPYYAQARLNRGYLYLQQQSYPQAESDFNQVLSLENNRSDIDSEAYTLRGLCYLKQNELQAALADLNRAIHYEPLHVEAYLNRGQVYEKMGKTAMAYDT